LSWGKDTARALLESASERRPGCPKANRVCTARTSHPIPRNSVSTSSTCIRRSSQSRTGGIATPYPRRRCSYDQRLTTNRCRHWLLHCGWKRGREDHTQRCPNPEGSFSQESQLHKPLSWANRAGRDGSNRRPCGFPPGEAHLDRSAIIRVSHIRAAQQGGGGGCHPGGCGFVRLGADSFGRTLAESQRSARPTCRSTVDSADSRGRRGSQ